MRTNKRRDENSSQKISIMLITATTTLPAMCVHCVCVQLLPITGGGDNPVVRPCHFLYVQCRPRFISCLHYWLIFSRTTARREQTPSAACLFFPLSPLSIKWLARTDVKRERKKSSCLVSLCVEEASRSRTLRARVRFPLESLKRRCLLKRELSYSTGELGNAALKFFFMYCTVLYCLR